MPPPDENPRIMGSGRSTWDGGRRLVAILAGVAVALGSLLVTGVETASARPEPSWRVFVLTRTTDGPSYIEIQAGAEAALDGRELIAAIPLTADAKGRVTDTNRGILFASEGGGFPEAYAFGERAGCEETGDPQGACNVVSTGGGRSTAMTFDYGDGDAPSHVIIAVHAARSSVKLGRTTRGWALAEVRGQRPAVTSAQDADAAGAHHRMGGGAELFLSASSKGGRRGSIVIAQPPCGYPPNAGFVNLGAGRALLTGGVVDRESICPGVYMANDDGYYAMTSFAHARATWTLDGAVAGTTGSMASVRLVTLDVTRSLTSSLSR